MNTIFLQEMKERLLDERKLLLSKNNFSEEIDSDGDEIDKIQSTLIQAMNSNFESMNSRKLEQINAALKKLEEKEYGLCMDCGEEIPEKRLRINPYFELCVCCAEIKERNNRSFMRK